MKCTEETNMKKVLAKSLFSRSDFRQWEIKREMHFFSYKMEVLNFQNSGVELDGKIPCYSKMS